MTTTTPNDELLPCPFCGDAPRRRLCWDESLYSHASVQYLQIVCDTCDAASMSSETHNEVVTAWNRRAQPSYSASLNSSVPATAAVQQEPTAEFSARVSMLLTHAKRASRVSHEEVLEIAAMEPDDLRRRAIVARDWHRAYQECLDGLALKVGHHHAVPAGCWFPKDIRMLVEQLLTTPSPKAEPASAEPGDAATSKPMTDAQIDALFQPIQAEVAKLTEEGRYSFAGWLPIAVRAVEAHHGIGAGNKVSAELGDAEMLEHAEAVARRVGAVNAGHLTAGPRSLLVSPGDLLRFVVEFDATKPQKGA